MKGVKTRDRVLLGIFAASSLATAVATTAVAQATKGELGKPDVLIVASGMPAEESNTQTRTARTFYTFWTTNDVTQGKSVISPSFTDRDLPPGRPQGPAGPIFANAQFHKAVPDLQCHVLQQIVAGDRVVTNMRFTGHFTGKFGSIQGKGQQVDFVATDILRIVGGKITDNWHLEDNLTFQKQIGAVMNK